MSGSAAALGISLTVLTLTGCGDGESGGPCSSSKPRSDTVIFASCDGNVLHSCVPTTPGASSGTTTTTDCAAQGLACKLSPTAAGVDSCGVAAVGDRCRSKDAKTCDAQRQSLRCVWVSEQPEPGLSGDIGVWRPEKACTAGCSGGECV